MQQSEIVISEPQKATGRRIMLDIALLENINKDQFSDLGLLYTLKALQEQGFTLIAISPSGVVPHSTHVQEILTKNELFITVCSIDMVCAYSDQNKKATNCYSENGKNIQALKERKFPKVYKVAPENLSGKLSALRTDLKPSAESQSLALTMELQQRQSERRERSSQDPAQSAPASSPIPLPLSPAVQPVDQETSAVRRALPTQPGVTQQPVFQKPVAQQISTSAPVLSNPSPVGNQTTSVKKIMRGVPLVKSVAESEGMQQTPISGNIFASSNPVSERKTRGGQPQSTGESPLSPAPVVMPVVTSRPLPQTGSQINNSLSSPPSQPLPLPPVVNASDSAVMIPTIRRQPLPQTRGGQPINGLSSLPPSQPLPLPPVVNTKSPAVTTPVLSPQPLPRPASTSVNNAANPQSLLPTLERSRSEQRSRDFNPEKSLTNLLINSGVNPGGLCLEVNDPFQKEAKNKTSYKTAMGASLYSLIMGNDDVSMDRTLPQISRNHTGGIHLKIPTFSGSADKTLAMKYQKNFATFHTKCTELLNDKQFFALGPMNDDGKADANLHHDFNNVNELKTFFSKLGVLEKVNIEGTYKELCKDEYLSPTETDDAWNQYNQVQTPEEKSGILAWFGS